MLPLVLFRPLESEADDPMRRSSFLGAALCLALAETSCSGGDGDSKADIKKQISTQLQHGGEGFDKKTADCFADIVIDEVGVEELKDVDFDTDTPPAELQDEIAAAAERATEECDLGALEG